MAGVLKTARTEDGVSLGVTTSCSPRGKRQEAKCARWTVNMFKCAFGCPFLAFETDVRVPPGYRQKH